MPLFGRVAQALCVGLVLAVVYFGLGFEAATLVGISMVYGEVAGRGGRS